MIAGSKPEKAVDDTEQLRAQVDRILHSSVFSGSELLRLLLSFLADRAIESPGEHLKVKEIATRVFHRADDFDSQTDSVVRVHMGRLRSKLAEFYMTEGAADEIVLEVPRGAYFLAQHLRRAQRTADLPIHVSIVETPAVETPAVESPAPEPVATPRRDPKRLLLPFATVLLLVICAWLAIQNRELRRGASGEKGLGMLPWSVLEAGDLRIPVVIADSSVGLAQDIVHGGLSLKEYMNHDYLAGAKPVSPELGALAQLLARRELTSLADAETGARIVRLDPVLSRRAVVRFARNMRLDEFKDGNNVLIGSYRANHWVELFQGDLNFDVEYDEAREAHFCRNRSPRTGEQEIYRPSGPTGTSGEAYAVVALVLNHSGKGHTLLITGTNTESSQAAGEFITSAERYPAALRNIGIDPKGPPRGFEILLKVKVIAGGVDRSEVVAYRVR